MFHKFTPEKASELTPPLILILQLAANGFTYKEIAHQLKKSVGTIFKQSELARKILHSRTITQAACIAVKHNLITIC